MRIILASGSESRQKLLLSLGLPFETLPHGVDEEALKKKIKDPHVLCPELARAKVKSAYQQGAFVIGADQMVLLKGRFSKTHVFGKPKTFDRAFETLSFLQGKSHELICALCLQKPDGSLFEKTTINQMTMRPLSDEQIKFYLEQDRPYNCAGAYRIEKRGISLFEKIETPEFYSILGLPMISLCSQIPILQN